MTTRFRKFLTTGLAVAALAAAAAATPAAARDGRNGAFFGGLVAGGLLGGVLAPHYGYGYPARPYYEGGYNEEPDCWLERRPIYNAWGDVVRYRRVRICN